MRTLVLTAYDDAFAPLGALTAARMLSYASRHGFDFRCARVASGPVPPSWNKVILVNDALYEFDRVMWLDADQLITNPAIVPETTRGFNASKDWGTDATEGAHFSMGGFIAYPDAISLLRRANSIMPVRLNTPFWEQGVMRELYPEFRDVMTIHPRRTFNAVPLEMHPTAPEPWRPGDFCAHLTSASIEDRIKMLRKLP